MFVLLSLLLSMSASVAFAQEGGAPLTYVAPANCPSRAALVAEIERILMRPWSELPSDVGIAVQLERVEGDFVLSVVLAEGERRLSDAECRPLMLAAALIVALAIDPDAAVRSATTEPVLEVTPVVVMPVVDVPVVAAPPRVALGSPSDTRAAEVRGPPPLGIGAGVVLDVGLLPEPSFGAALEGIIRFESFDLRLRATYLAPSTAQRSDGIGAEVSAFAVDVHGCVRPVASPALGLCGGLHAGALMGTATGPITGPVPGQTPGAWVAVGAGLWLPWSPWDALDIELSVEGLLSLLRPRFDIDGVGTVFTPFSAGARVGLLVHLDLRP